MTCVKGIVSQNKYPFAICKLGLFLENTFSALKCNFLNAHVGYISSFYRLKIIELSCVKITHLTPDFTSRFSTFLVAYFQKKKKLRAFQLPLIMHKELYLIRNPHRVPDLIFWYCVNLKIEVWKAMITRIRFPLNNFATFWKLHNFDFPLRIFRSVAALQYSTYHEAVTSVRLKSKTNFLTLKICKRVQVHSQRHALRISTHLIGYLYARLIVAELSCLRKQTLNLSQADVSVVYNACSLREKKTKKTTLTLITIIIIITVFILTRQRYISFVTWTP